jgi:glycosyltransferase involved in cell wall biosynthesis
MSCGIPCVSFRCEYGPEDIITDGIDGILVNDGNVEDLANKILWMATNPDKRKSMGLEARSKALLFDKDTIMPTWTKLFNSLIS